jgi:cytochrome c oxidase assembly factor 6
MQQLFLQARDAFYTCLKDCGVLYVPGAQVPVKCAALRAAFEGSCLPSWVSSNEWWHANLS